MNELGNILLELRDTDVTSGELNALALRYPSDEILGVNRDALARRRTDLERSLHSRLRPAQTDLLEYQVQSRDGAACPAQGVALSLSFFQDILTATFAAVRERTGAPSIDEPGDLAALTFAAGERGASFVTLSMPNERLLLIQSDIEVALGLIFDLLKTQTTSRLRQVSTTIGVAPITSAWRWAKNSIDYGFTISVRWQKAGEWDRRVTISAQEAWLLKSAIDEIEDELVDTIVLDGELVGFDHVRGDFHLKTGEGQIISGRLADSFSPDATIQIARLYRVTLTRTSTIRFATGEERVKWLLREITVRD